MAANKGELLFHFDFDILYIQNTQNKISLNCKNNLAICNNKEWT